jgi:predicted GNAT superfamily acetyltransferase
MHSHIAGVSGAALGRSVGFALKLHQRAWALHRGVCTIGWTFDPLVCRNAYFNLSKLAALPAQYLPNFYGAMNDGINGSDDTDRLLVHWELTTAAVVAACARSLAPRDVAAERARGAVVALRRSARNRPVTGTTDGNVLLVAVPADIAAVRRTDPGVAKEWRVAVREVLAPLMAEGARVTGFDRSGWYVVTRETRRDDR